MQRRKLILSTIILCFYALKTIAQNKIDFAAADSNSYNLYLKAQWKDLLTYGNIAIEDGQDFSMLRLRMGYAALMNQNYSEALKQYDAVLLKDSYNQTALYYNWYCRTMLNQTELSTTLVKQFSNENLKASGVKKIMLTGVSVDNSYKITDVTTRENSIYNRISLQARLGWKFNIEQSVALYNQTINEPHLYYVQNNLSIKIPQKEYYAKASYNLNKHLQIIGAYHYLYTPFNNFIYQNHIGLAGIQYFGYKMNIQADFNLAKLSDTAVKQMNIQFKYLPKGNMNIYAISVVSISQRNNVSRTNFKEIAGLKIHKNAWLEGNVTLNKFSNYLENDALYVYNAIDANKLKAGITLYMLFGKHLNIQAGYVYEKRELYDHNYIYNQNSINGGLTWKF